MEKNLKLVFGRQKWGRRMVIAFRDAGAGQISTAQAVSSYALLLAKRSGKRTLLFSIRRAEGKPEDFLAKGIAKSKRCGAGIEAVRKLVVAGLVDKKGIYSCTRQVTEELDLLPGSFPAVEERLEKEYAVGLPLVMECLSDCYEFLVCDAGGTGDGLGKGVEKEADLIVKNIGQDPRVLCKFASEEHKNKVFYLFGDYDSESKYNLHNLRRKFNFLDKKNSSVLPRCTQVRDACMDGTLAAFYGQWEDERISGSLHEYGKALGRFEEKVKEMLEGGGARFIYG